MLLRSGFITPALLLRSIPIGIVIAAGVVATTWTHSLLTDHQKLVVTTYQIIDTTKDLLIALDDAETGERGFLVSGDRRFLDPYDKALQRLAKLRDTLGSSLSQDEAQSSRMRNLNDLVDRKLQELQHSIGVHDQKGSSEARSLETRRMEEGTMDEIRKVIGMVTESEKALLASRQTEVDQDETVIRVVAIVVGIASFLTRAGIEFYLRRKEQRGTSLA